jgi:hypothetical protein
MENHAMSDYLFSDHSADARFEILAIVAYGPVPNFGPYAYERMGEEEEQIYAIAMELATGYALEGVYTPLFKSIKLKLAFEQAHANGWSWIKTQRLACAVLVALEDWDDEGLDGYICGSATDDLNRILSSLTFRGVQG